MPFSDEEAQSLLAVKGIAKPYCSVCSKWAWMILPHWRQQIWTMFWNRVHN